MADKREQHPYRPADDAARARQHARRNDGRRRYRAGLPDYHDPLAGFGGAPPAQSALTLRLVLAAFGLVFCGVAAGLTALAGLVVASAVLSALAAVALVDIAVIVRRKRRGEPG